MPTTAIQLLINWKNHSPEQREWSICGGSDSIVVMMSEIVFYYRKAGSRGETRESSIRKTREIISSATVMTEVVDVVAIAVENMITKFDACETLYWQIQDGVGRSWRDSDV